MRELTCIRDTLIAEDHGSMTDDALRDAGPEHGSETATPHPEEMKATVNLRIGDSISVTAMIRTTPAGLVAAALLVSAVLLLPIWRARDRARECIRG